MNGFNGANNNDGKRGIENRIQITPENIAVCGWMRYGSC